MSEPLAYSNGRFMPAAQAQLAYWDAGLVLGATVAEMTRTFRHQPYQLEEHVHRLFCALDVLGLDIGLSATALADLSRELLAHNARLVDDTTELGLVQFVTAGEYALYAGRPPRTGPTVCMHTFALPFHRWADKLRRGTHLMTPTIRQVPPQCWDPAMKCRSRMHYYLAEQEVHRHDPEASALLLDLAGHMTETSTGNFLMVERGVLVSPPATYTRPGVSRATVIELAGELGIPFAERDIPLLEALAADEVFLSSTTYCLMPVTRINETPIGDGQPGPVFRRLLAAWSARVGVNIERQIVASSP
jgi:branched-subunit amino acid aminotransferase/4-amino-4-deoxychorismate lyase